MAGPVPGEEEEAGGVQHPQGLSAWGCWAVGGMSWELELPDSSLRQLQQWEVEIS